MIYLFPVVDIPLRIVLFLEVRNLQFAKIFIPATNIKHKQNKLEKR